MAIGNVELMHVRVFSHTLWHGNSINEIRKKTDEEGRSEE